MSDRTEKTINATDKITFAERDYQETEYDSENDFEYDLVNHSDTLQSPEGFVPNEFISEEEQEEQLRKEARMQRRERMRKEKERQLLIRRLVLLVLPVVCILLAVILITGRKTAEKQLAQEQKDSAGIEPVTSTEVSTEGISHSEEDTLEQDDLSETEEEKAEEGFVGEQTVFAASFGDNVKQISEEDVESTYAIVVDIDNAQVLAAREAKTRISPASMTKILTVLVAAEHIHNLDDKVPITIDITDYAFANDCSTVGFSKDEEVTVRDLMYGTILPSGADAAVALAKYVAGSHEAFVDLMNEKLQSMGLSATTHFTNCVGLYDENHYSTVYDMAMILQAAVENDLCRDVLNAHTFTTSGTDEHPNGITISNWFLRRIEDKPVPGEVLCAKTGFVVQSRNCAASYGKSNSGKRIICVTADAHSSWRAIYDHVALYNAFM